MGTTMDLTRRVRFSAAHRYYRPEWDESKNREVFGPCSNPHGHGHNYVLDVTVRGETDAETGFCVDLGELDRVLRREVVDVLDHRHINHAVPEFAEGRAIPTSENVLRYLWPRIEAGLSDGVALVRLKLAEDDSFFVELQRGSVS